MGENGFKKLKFPYHEANICNGGVKCIFEKKNNALLQDVKRV